MGDAFFEGEKGRVSTLPTGDVWIGSQLVWRNDVTTGYRGDSVRATQAHFVSCLRAGAPFETGGREYLHTFATEAAYRSIAERRQIALSEIGSLTRVGSASIHRDLTASSINVIAIWMIVRFRQLKNAGAILDFVSRLTCQAGGGSALSKS